eukprot:57998-Hanusia_phi.AAC.1
MLCDATIERKEEALSQSSRTSCVEQRGGLVLIDSIPHLCLMPLPASATLKEIQNYMTQSGYVGFAWFHGVSILASGHQCFLKSVRRCRCMQTQFFSVSLISSKSEKDRDRRYVNSNPPRWRTIARTCSTKRRAGDNDQAEAGMLVPCWHKRLLTVGSAQGIADTGMAPKL